jgi:glycosyltransferase involved in cell wall biosynthesis
MGNIDIIVPCYNYGRYLRQAVDSVLTQDWPQVRVLILDDASNDDSAIVADALAREDSRASVVHHATNCGNIATYNEGLAWVESDYLLILSADDYLLPGSLRRAVKFMDANPMIAFCFGGVYVLHEDGTYREMQSFPFRDSVSILPGLDFIERSGASNIVFSPTAIVRTKYQRWLGGYCADLPHCADMELWLRLAAHGAVGYIRTPQAVYRRHNSSMSVGYTDTYLPDLQQRGAALDYFFLHHAHMIPYAAKVQVRNKYLLACSATACASAAFEQGQNDVASELVRFALGIAPRVRLSKAWMKFACKRLLGLSMTRTLRSFLSPLEAKKH